MKCGLVGEGRAMLQKRSFFGDETAEIYVMTMSGNLCYIYLQGVVL